MGEEIAMPDTPRLPAHPSFDQLQKQAKELLRRYRAGHQDAAERIRAANSRLFEPGARAVTLADAQFALALELGFESWAALKHHITAPHSGGLDAFDRIAKELADAYTAGDTAAIRRINWRYGTSFACDFHETAEAQRQLPAWFAAEARTHDLALGDTRRMIAHSYGFSNWEAFAAQFARPASSPRGPSPAYSFDDRALCASGPLSPDDWDAIAGVMKEREIDSLRAGGITDTGLAHLSRLEGLKHLDLDGSSELTDAGLALLASFPRLESLNLSGVKGRITDHGLEVLRRLPALASIRLCWQANISDAGIAGLAACDRLAEVDLLGTPTGDGAIRALMAKPSLQVFKSGRNVTNAGIALLHEFPAFKTWQGGEPRSGLMAADPGPNHLLLDGSFTAAGIAALSTLEGLVALSLFWHCSSFSGDDLGPLKLLPHLAVLGCGGERCDDAAMRHIAVFPRLRKLMAQGTVASDAGFAALSRSHTLEYLWGRECPNLTGSGFASLAAMPRLAGLAVSCRNVEDPALAMLPRFRALREFLPMDIPDRGFRHIGSCEGLEALWCMYCRNTGDDATQHIAGLRLKSYYAGQTRITDRSLEILGRMSSLERIELRACPGITDTGVAQLAGLTKLRELKLASLLGVTPSVGARFGSGVRVKFDG